MNEVLGDLESFKIDNTCMIHVWIVGKNHVHNSDHVWLDVQKFSSEFQSVKRMVVIHVGI